MILKRQMKVNYRILFILSMIFLALANAWPRLLPVTFGAGPDLIDGIRGFLFGVFFALIIWWLSVQTLRRRRDN